MSGLNFTDLSQLLAGQFIRFRRETGLDLKEEYLELRVHPDDLAMVRMTADNLYFDFDRFVEERGLLGIPMIADPEVSVGHPVLKSTWEVAL